MGQMLVKQSWSVSISIRSTSYSHMYFGFRRELKQDGKALAVNALLFLRIIEHYDSAYFIIDNKCVAVKSCVAVAQCEKILYRRQHWEAEALCAVMHGYGDARLDDIDHALCGSGVYRIEAADGYQQDIHAVQSRCLLIGQFAAYVSEMCNANIIDGDDVYGVFAALFTLYIVMIRAELGDGERHVMDSGELYSLGIAVIIVAVAAQHDIRSFIYVSKAGNTAGLEGIEHQTMLSCRDLKCRMSEPTNGYGITHGASSFAFFCIIAQKMCIYSPFRQDAKYFRKINYAENLCNFLAFFAV